METLDFLEKDTQVSLPERYRQMDEATMTNRIREIKKKFGPMPRVIRAKIARNRQLICYLKAYKIT